MYTTMLFRPLLLTDFLQKSIGICLFFLFMPARNGYAQCSSVPIPLRQRVENATSIILGKPVDRHCYADNDGNIYTLCILNVLAYLKNNTGQKQVAVITLGGVLDDHAQITFPHLEIEAENEYILFLESDNTVLDDKNYRALHPDLIQALPYAESQGALTYQFGLYHDLLVEPPKNEAATFSSIENWTQQSATTPKGAAFLPRQYNFSQPEFFPITTFSPNPTNAGTVVPGEFLNISGSGFGAAAGTVSYSNADDGGATFISSGVASDNVSWSATDITNKVGAKAGTGPISINGTITSSTPLTIGYAHTNINSMFSGFSVTTRQRYYLVNKNGSGGYTFQYNTTSGFASNTAATNAFARALETWRCATFINWNIQGTTTVGATTDGISSVSFNSGLPMGVLGRATSRFNGNASGGCTLDNTVWYLNEIDVEMNTTPSPGLTWQYGPALPSFSQFDFESVLAHELGHGHGLGHRLAPGEMMYYAITNGTAIRSPAAQEIAGGVAKVNYSTPPLCFTPGGINGPMVALNAGSCVLPIELLAFEARKNSEAVDLTWSTASENDNDYFTLERSPDSRNFSPITQMPGAGNSTTTQHYTYTDQKPLPGINYYRLKQTDFNGQYAYSKVLSIKMEQQGTTFGIRQNPVQGQMLQLVMNAPTQDQAAVTIMNAAGQQIATQVVSIEKGNTDQMIDLGNLPNGMYYVKITCSGKTNVLPFLLQE